MADNVVGEHKSFLANVYTFALVSAQLLRVRSRIHSESAISLVEDVFQFRLQQIPALLQILANHIVDLFDHLRAVVPECWYCIFGRQPGPYAS